MKYILVLFLLIQSVLAVSQNIDSLKLALQSASDKSIPYNELSEISKSNSDYSLIKKYADSALYYAKSKQNTLEQGKAYINIGDYYYYVSAYDSCIGYYKKAAAIFAETNNHADIASAYSNIGAIFFSKSDFDNALVSFDKAAEFQKLSKDSNELAIIYNNIATVHYYTDNYAKAIEFYNKSLSLKKQSKDYTSIAKSLNNLASIYGDIGDYEKSINLYYESSRICDKSNNKSLKATTYSNIAGIYKDWQQYDKALDLYEQALVIKKEIKDLNGKANILNNMGLVYRLMDQLNKAEENFNKSISIFEKIGNKKRLAIVYSNLAKIYDSKGDYSKSIQRYLTCLEINKSINSPKNIAFDYLDLSRAYLHLEDLQTAEKYISQCDKLADSLNLNSIKADIYKLYSELYEAKGNYHKSLDNYKLYSELKESNFSSEKIKLLNETNAKYETEKKNKEIEVLNIWTKQQETEIEAKRQERNLWLGISILSVLIGVVFVYFFLNKKKLSESLSQKNILIEKTSAEKDVLLREIHHRVKNNLQIISSLLNMQSRYLSDDKSKEIVNESQNRIKSMSLIHQKLYQEDNLTGIATKIYFEELIESLSLSYGIKSEQIKLEIEDMLLDVDTAIPIGLILNEMISNAFKHGVKEKSGRFSFTFKRQSQEELLIKIKDNGPGIPEDFDIKKSKSYGMKLIQSLSKKLKADVSFKNNQGLETTMIIRRFKLGNVS